MKLSTRSRYGTRMMFELALHYEKGPLQLSEIAKKEKISEKYLGQIVILLRSANLVDSVRGSQGGYLLTRAPDKISLKDIVQVLEGSICVLECLEKKNCERISECVARKAWMILEDVIVQALEGITLDTMINWHLQDKKNLNFEI
jgi:Rrf2 family transcriptional regulator, cysteine metabolism repressor